MASAYVGMRVKLILNTGALLEGVVKDVDQVNGSIEVDQVTLNFKGATRELGPQRVSATKIKDLQFVTDAASSNGSSMPESSILKREKPAAASSSSTKAAKQLPPPSLQAQIHHDVDQVVDFEEYQSPPPPVKAPPVYNKRRPYNSNTNSNGQVRSNRNQGSGARSRLKNPYTEDFDFQASAELFDKERIFAEIRQNDETDPELLLVSLNKATKHQQQQLPSLITASRDPQQRKLGHRENVLDSQVQIQLSQEDNSTDGVISPVNEADELFEDPYRRRRESKTLTSTTRKSSVTFIRPEFKTTSSIKIPSLTPTEYALLESICFNDTGTSFDQLVEGGARETATIVLQALGGSRRFTSKNHNAKPYIIVFCGNSTRVGAIGLAAARHLANHECRVDVVVLGSESDVTNVVAMQIKILQHTGTNLIKSNVNSLPSPSQALPDLVIDAILGADIGPSDIPDLMSRAEVEDAISWISNVTRSPVCSLECPSGLGGSHNYRNTVSEESDSMISARWTIAFGAPMSILGSSRVTSSDGRNLVGEVLLVDVGIPKAAFTRFVKKTTKTKQPSDDVKYIPCFNDKFIVAIELL